MQRKRYGRGSFAAILQEDDGRPSLSRKVIDKKQKKTPIINLAHIISGKIDYFCRQENIRNTL
jgi:hypothetical protein